MLSLSHPERVAALAAFGYETAEANFLIPTALHGGYFVRRQLLTCLHGTRGWKDVSLLNKLRDNGHCRASVYRHGRIIYHLSAKPFYEAIGEPNNRNRRERQPITIKNKLMGLDFVLAHPHYDYLATESEKLHYFVDNRKVSSADLPTRWYASPRGSGQTPKHFVDKFPMFLANTSGGGNVPVVHFCYVDEGSQSIDGFRTYLVQYSRLLSTLKNFHVVYIAAHHGLIGRARQTFHTQCNKSHLQEPPTDPAIQELLTYFLTQQQYEAKDFSQFDTTKIIQFREAKKRFSGTEYAGLYQHWLAGGDAAVMATLYPNNTFAAPPIKQFSTYVLEHDYGLFGTNLRGDRTSEGSHYAQT